MAWDRSKAVKFLQDNANVDKQGVSHSLGKCAEYVRKAIEAGGVTLTRHKSAKDYGSSLTQCGFTALSDYKGTFFAGDVAIIQPIPNHPHGHMAMFDGKIWISDFKQYYGYYPGKSYRAQKPPVKIYRYPGVVAAPPRTCSTTMYA